MKGFTAVYDDNLDEEELHDWEDPEPDDDDAETLPCPKCGKQVYEEAEQCPYCGTFVTHSTSIWAGRPWWFIALGGLGILAMIYALLFVF